MFGQTSKYLLVPCMVYDRTETTPRGCVEVHVVRFCFISMSDLKDLDGDKYVRTSFIAANASEVIVNYEAFDGQWRKHQFGILNYYVGHACVWSNS